MHTQGAGRGISLGVQRSVPLPEATLSSWSKKPALVFIVPLVTTTLDFNCLIVKIRK